MSTTIYLDVDGVINAVSVKISSLQKFTGWETWDTKPVNGWPILWSPEVVDVINTLAARDDITIKWLTTWEEDARLELCPALGINGQDWEVLHGDQHAWRGRDWWKLAAIQHDVEITNPGKVVWIDDDIRPERNAVTWAEALPCALWISPETRWGLTRKHIDTITTFIDATTENPA